MRGRKRDYIDEIIKQGAFVVKPKPVVAPEPELVSEISTEISLDSAAARLKKRWHNDPQETAPEIPATEYAEYNGGPEPIIGDVLDLVVVAWMTHDKTGQNRGGIGLARIPRGSRRQEKRSDGCHFKEADIISLGVETLRPGSRIRARLTDPTSDGHPFVLKDIEIYQD
jgi:hypothetical protein